jgi:transposase InsO family protein
LFKKFTPSSSGQHKWILIVKDYFTKWIKAIPRRSASHKVILGFLKDIMERFGCLNRIITDNTASFKAEPLVKFYEQFRISLIHSTPYYPQGNRLAESSNKSLIKIIKRLLEDNKKVWYSKLKFSLWDDIVTTKRSLDLSPFDLVYGAKVIFPSHLALLIEKLFQDYQEEPNDMIRRVKQLAEVRQTREKLLDKAHERQQKIKQVFDRKVRKEDL